MTTKDDPATTKDAVAIVFCRHFAPRGNGRDTAAAPSRASGNRPRPPAG
jgi:hypothetical protein